MQRGRPPGMHQPAAFGRTISQSNISRAVLRRLRQSEQARTKAFASTVVCRQDEEEFFGRKPAEGLQKLHGVNHDKNVNTDAWIMNAFAGNPGCVTGLKDNSSVRLRYIVVSCLLLLQLEALQRVLVEEHQYLVFKRSSDETPLFVRGKGKDAAVSSIKVLSQRAHVRWGSLGCERSERIVLPGVELLGTDTLALMEGMDRAMPGARFAYLCRQSERARFCASVFLADSASANKLQFELAASLSPRSLNMFQRCDSHQLAICTLRPFDKQAQDLVNGLFAFSKLVRKRAVRDHLSSRVLRLVRTEVKANMFVAVPPDGASRGLQSLMLREILDVVAAWAEQSQRADVLPRLQRVRDDVQQGLPLFLSMFNGLSHAGFCG